MSAGYAALTNVGRVRSTNQDRYLAQPPLFAVADGMGGQAAGEVAAQLVVDALAEALRDGSIRDADTLGAAVELANRRVREAARNDPALTGMGTTCSAVAIFDGRMFVAHVGDSRGYVLRDGSLLPLTEDHSAVGRLVRDGLLSEDDALVHPQRHILSRAIGAADDVAVDVRTDAWRSGDRLVLCSDGLSGLVTPASMEAILGRAADPEAAAAGLVEAALAAGGSDNITVLVVDPAAVSSPAPPGADVPVAPRVEEGLRPARRGRALGLVGVAILLAVLGIGLLAVVLNSGAPGPDESASPSPLASPTILTPTPSASTPNASPIPTAPSLATPRPLGTPQPSGPPQAPQPPSSVLPAPPAD